MAVLRYSRSIPELFTDVVSQLTALLRNEAQLARAEVSAKVNRAVYGLVFVVAGAVLLIPALVIILGAGVSALIGNGFSEPVACLIVGGGALLIGLIVAAIGVSRLKPEAFVPDKTIHQLQQDASVAKDQVRPHHEQYRAA